MRLRIPSLLTLGLALLLLGACGGGGGGDGDGGGGGGGGIGDIPSPANEGAPVASAAFDYCLNKLNGIRNARGLVPFTRDGALDAFAMNAARLFLTDGIPHNYFNLNNVGCSAAGFNTMCAENQGWAGGFGSDNANIDQMIDGMMAEEFAFPPGDPNRGHFETIVNPALARIGIGLVQRTDGVLFLSNDFSN